ncbi:MAG: hypothetical protein K2X27_07650, partial [Candidatus Obscuribacterales bacterium]|nr:hypothetical protein [Candidatus Obscuribacterales bacterium]
MTSLLLLIGPALPTLQPLPVRAETSGNPTQTVLTPVDYSSGLTNQSGSTLILDLGDKSSISVLGNLENHGTIYLVSSNPHTQSASISAQNIINSQGAIITTVIPQGAIPLGTFSSLVSNLSLSLFAVNNIVNYGTISSANNLTAVAGGSIVNMTAAGSATAAIMQATNNLNLSASTISNSGILSAINGNVNLCNPSLYSATLAGLQQNLAGNISSSLLQNININNSNGLIEALKGSVNIGGAELDKNSILSVLGGDIISQLINVDGGAGAVQVRADSLLGTVNLSACSAQFGAESGLLTLGQLNIAGDPTFYNSGDILITNNINVGENLAILAGGNITASGAYTISTVNLGVGHNVYMVAGGNLSLQGSPLASPTLPPGNALLPGQTVTVSGPSLTGGSISLAGSTINTRSTAGNNPGGTVTLVAYGGLGTGGISNLNIVSGGSGLSTDGAVNV